MTDLGQQEVEDAWNAFIAKHTRTTAKQWLIHLNLLWNFAVRQGMVRGAYPWRLRQIKAQAKPKNLLPTSLGGDWFQCLKRVCSDPGVVGVVALMLGVGLRFSEASGARWEWFDWDAMTYTPGKTKGFEAWERPIQPWVLMALPERKPEGPMLLNRYGRPVKIKAVQYAMDAACKAAGIRRLTPHCLRHTYGSQLADAGASEKAIQIVMGHKDPRTTRGYIHPDQTQVLRAQTIAAERMGMTRAKTAQSPPLISRES
jgi:site-specific recombinase XerC